jgi:hypothetical protein
MPDPESRSRPACRDDWRTEPIPAIATPLSVEVSYSSEEFDQIRLGLIPLEMEDKWFVYLEGDEIFIHRSWTGQVWYRARFVQRIDGSWSVHDAVTYPTTGWDDHDYNASMLMWVIDRLLLGKPVPLPDLPEQAVEEIQKSSPEQVPEVDVPLHSRTEAFEPESHETPKPVGFVSKLIHRRVERVRRLRAALVAEALRPEEEVLCETLAETLASSAPKASGFPMQGQPVILYATTNRVIWAGTKGRRYQPHPFPQGDHYRSLLYEEIKGCGAIGDIGGPGFTVIVLGPEVAAGLPETGRAGLLTVPELDRWSIRAGMQPGTMAIMLRMGASFDDSDYLQLFRLPVWGPQADELTRAIRQRLG